MPAARFVLALMALGAPALIAASAAADETGLAGMHAWRVERGKTCLAEHYHTGQGNGPTKKAAQAAAIDDWEGFTAFEYGSAWARFRGASDRGVRYEKTSDGWTANVEGRPCRARTRSTRR